MIYFSMKIKKFICDDEGATAVEFGMLVAPIIGFIITFIDVGYWSIANTTLKKATHNTLQEWIVTKDKTTITLLSIEKRVCKNISAIGIPCNSDFLKININYLTSADNSGENLLNFQSLYRLHNSRRLLILKLRLVWPNFFPVSKFLMRVQNETARNIYSATLLPI